MFFISIPNSVNMTKIPRRNRFLEILKFQRIWLSNRVHLESNLTQLGVIENVSSIEQKGRLGHGFVDTFIVQSLEFIPFRQNTHGVSLFTGRDGISRSHYIFLQSGCVVLVDVACVVQLGPHVLTFDFWIVDVNLGLFLEQISQDKHARCFTNISGILLEGISQQGNLFSRHGVEHLLDNLFRKALFLIIVHENDLIPIGGTFIKSVGLTKVDEIQNILLEA
mmetsp:Transcript_1737/g.4195  ORF Transcript_1737/g.4195 Transcript_1737/m.4195 type:complete len:222 (+) Transcript_1737:1007-1672(+)